MKILLSSLIAASFLSIATPHLGAEGYPNQAINLVIPLAPGDAADIACRTMGEELSKLLKVPIIVVNRPGAGGTLGTDSAVKAKKDGYTILLTNNAALIYNRVLTPESVAYDPFKDLTPLGLATRFPLLVLALGTLMSHMKGGAMKGILTSNKIPEYPEIPTLPELGYRQNLFGVWLAFFAPAGVPAEVTKALVPAVEKAVKDPAVASKLAGLGMVQDYVPPEKLFAEIREEHRTVEEIGKKAGMIK